MFNWYLRVSMIWFRYTHIYYVCIFKVLFEPSIHPPFLCEHISLWLEMGNLKHLPFGMILNLYIRLLHSSGLLGHKISQKKWKRSKKFFWRPRQRPDRKRLFFIYFCPNIIKWLRKFSQCLWFDLQGHKDQKGHKKAKYL